MKTSYILSGIALIIIAVLAAVGIYMQSTSKPIEFSEQASSTAASVTLTSIRSDVFAKMNADLNGILIASSTTLSQNDGVRTGATGRALLENGDLKTVIDHDSEISISELKDKQAHLAMNSGSVWLRVEKVFGIGEGVEVETPNAVAAVRGTSFGLLYKNGITTLLVGEGTVGLRAKDSSTGSTSPEILVTKDQKGVIGSDGKIKVSPLTTGDKSSEWFTYNNPSPEENTEGTPTKGDANTSTNTNTTNTNTAPNTTITTTNTNTNISNPTTGSGGSSGNVQATSSPSLIQITSVSPSQVSSASPTRVAVSGSGFKLATKLLLGSIGLQFMVIDDQNITFTVQEMDPGTYDLTISGSNSEVIRKGAITITGVAPNYNAQGY